MYWTGPEENIYSTLDIFSELEVKNYISRWPDRWTGNCQGLGPKARLELDS